MLRYLGHDRVAVLDGGLRAWNRKGRPLKAGTEGRPPRRFAARVRAAMRVGVEQLTHPRDASVQMLLDARAPERYRGEVEPIDPVAGHIPGARNHPWETNLDGELRFLPLETLRNRFESTLGDLSPEGVVVYCGSGVTACHDLLAMEHAGLSGARLYAGSWSEWCADARRPVATGDAL
jgi:thiosulfate/3-mercaptopyruvate sulfurtransferase